jgi:hypothetical protein
MSKSQYVYMMQCIKNEYENRILGNLIQARPMLCPVTPRLGLFLDPRQTGDINGIVVTPMALQPRRLIVRGKFLLLAFEAGKAANLTELDLIKFKKLYTPYTKPQVIPDAAPNSLDSLPWIEDVSHEL